MTQWFGHAVNMQRFMSAIQSGRLHHGWIFSGLKGLGKAHFAKEAARMLTDPADQYRSMIDNGSHPDIIMVARQPKEMPKEGQEVDPEGELKRNISVQQIRDLQKRLTTRPGLSSSRVVIIDAADDLERGGANALLKSLEEPPKGTYFLLISHASDRLLPTIRSRCQMLRFEPLGSADMAQAITNQHPGLGKADIAALIAAGSGSPGQALDFAGLDLAALETAMQDIISYGDPTNTIRTTLSSALSLKAAHPRYEAFLRRVPQVIAAFARSCDTMTLPVAINAWAEATMLASRATGLTLDKQSVVFQMGSLLASLQTHKQ